MAHLEEDLKGLFLQVAGAIVEGNYLGRMVTVSSEEDVVFRELLSRGLFEYGDRSGSIDIPQVSYAQVVLTYEGKKLYEQLKTGESG